MIQIKVTITDEELKLGSSCTSDAFLLAQRKTEEFYEKVVKAIWEKVYGKQSVQHKRKRLSIRNNNTRGDR